ncbi:MAG TPA: SDR family NAD(P)-dependent oxidoreductase [Acidimicrobiales bacterium]|nr:SDR family NAD(P)-dependent oxidoreductase [Acidimicrobiales bacterium]
MRPVAVVTGASRGLGAGLARSFAARGYGLGLCARNVPPAPGGPGAAPLCAGVDVTDATALAAFAAEVVARFGRIDLWVNNAGLLEPIGPVATSDLHAAARLIQVNVTGVLNGSAVFARHVRSRPGAGVLINMSSGAGVRPYVGWGPYGASKAAVDQLTRIMAEEEAGHGLRAYAVSPGVVDTDMQALIRTTPPAAFPDVGRFVQIAADGAFNTTEWVAEHLVGLAFGHPEPGDVVVRVPDEPSSGRAH